MSTIIRSDEQNFSSSTNTSVENRHTVFLGRNDELAKLHSLLAKAESGSGSFVIVSSESGMGKSHLIQRFAAEAVVKGAIHASTSFSWASSIEPYSAFWKIADQLAGTVENPPDGGDHSTDAESVRDSNQLSSLQRIQNDMRLAQQKISALILEKARENLLVITIDDTQLGSTTAWRFLHYLSEWVSDYPVMVIIGLRDDGERRDPMNPPAYTDVRQRMNRERLYERIELTPFDQNQVKLYMNEAYPRSDFSNRFVPLLWEISHGIPGRLANTLRMLEEQQLVYEENGIWHERQSVNAETISGLFKDDKGLQVILEQIGDLDEPEQKIVKYAALMQASFPYVLLAEILKRPRHRLLKNIMGLQQRGIVQPADDASYQFTHFAAAANIREQIPVELKEEMQWEIIEAVDKAAKLTQIEKTFLLAFHYRHTSNTTCAFEWLGKAGHLALHNFAFTEAQTYFDQALEMAGSKSSVSPAAETIQLLLKSAWLKRLLVDREQALEQYLMALELCEQSGDRENKKQVLAHIGLTYFQLNKWTDAISFLEQTLTSSDESDAGVRALAKYGLGNVYIELSDYDQAREYFESALQLAGSVENSILQANIYNNLGVIENIQGNHSKAITTFSQAISRYKVIGDTSGIARTYLNIGFAYSDNQNWKMANDFYSKSLTLCDQMGFVPLKMLACLNRALAFTHLDQIDSAIEYNTKARRLATRLKDDLSLAEYYKNHAIIERTRNNWSSARENLQSAMDTFSSMNNPLGVAEVEHQQALLERAVENSEQMYYWWKRAIQSYEKLGLTKKVRSLEDEFPELSVIN